VGSSRKHPANFSPLAFDPGYHHAVVACRLVPHPGDGSSLGSLLNGNSLGPGDRATANRRGMIGNFSCDSGGEIGVFFMEAQEQDHGPQKVLDVLGLGFVTATSIGFLPFGETFCGTLGFDFSTDAFNRRR
jgi:hypothetical protein